jgi:hypothetical protein
VHSGVDQSRSLVVYQELVDADAELRLERADAVDAFRHLVYPRHGRVSSR